MEPETDNRNCFYTQLPSILFGMVEDTVALSKEISQTVVPRVVDVAVDEFHTFAAKYRDATAAYRGKHFEDRAFFKQYTATVIAIANNLDICVESTDKLEKHVRLTMETTTTGGGSGAESAADSGGRGSGGPTSRLSSLMSGGGGFSVVNRQELIEKIEQLKKKWNFGMQFA